MLDCSVEDVSFMGVSCVSGARGVGVWVFVASGTFRLLEGAICTRQMGEKEIRARTLDRQQYCCAVSMNADRKWFV